MFVLCNVGGKEVVLVLVEGLQCGSVFFCYEVGYVLGQLQYEVVVFGLVVILVWIIESFMVWYECVEVLGVIVRFVCLVVL